MTVREKQKVDFHKAITVKERSSRYIRTAFDFLKRNKGEQALDHFLEDIGLEKSSSVYKHITDDDNWNSYELELYITERIAGLFDDPYKAVWDFGVASGSGKFDQKSSLFNVKTKLAPTRLILKKISERTVELSLISTCSAQFIEPKKDSPYPRNARITFDYTNLPEGFKYPHWTSILAGAGIVYGVVRFRKGLDCVLHITHWPNLPSDFPTWRGEKYVFDRNSGDVLHERTGDVVANVNDGPFKIGDVTFNAGSAAHFEVELKPESTIKTLANMTFLRGRRRRQEEQAAYRQRLTNELNREHQAQLARYERELSEKTEIIRRQKIQQDGDYFLTSLLTNPINKNKNFSEHIKTDIFLEQKKKFNFRNRDGMLGGDLCVTDTIDLMDQNYVVVMNGDAMGKSLQGAGGMLVMGALFLSHLNRSKASVSRKHRGPENFIEQMYQEMQHLFLIFDGSMSMSVFLGLINESDGMMYYINCEHPWAVLLRDRQADFIEHELKIRKVGYEMGDSLKVDHFQLQPGDILMLGSDGRDDIAIDEVEGIRVINEDEYEFVNKVSKSGGDLDGLVELIRAHGDITDDLSLIRVEVKSLGHTGPVEKKNEAEKPVEQTPLTLSLTSYEKSIHYQDAVRYLESGERLRAIEAFERTLDEQGSVEPILRRLARLYFQEKDYTNTVRVVEEWQTANPSSFNTDMLYFQSCAWKMQRQFKRAARLGEKIREKHPNHRNNLINLIDCYRHLKLYKKALNLAEQVLDEEPGQPLVMQLKDAIEKTLSY